MSAGGKFRINVWTGGYPIWMELFYENQRLGQFNALELRDLGYAVEMARREASREAERMDRLHISDY